MKRGLDLIRNLLLKIEQSQSNFELMTQDIADALGIDGEYQMTPAEAKKIEYHLDLLADAGFVD
ncbi:DUF2513 domain-containing protein [uncultured Litoreibacter sp.]|uniref:DUF2513 domain-containing protein n=1 Tax=uncultured Litoreibacter sp. TaxID=1392394 RepID=UPI002629A7E6|nr:DUF2513 domain-containing protein [uncultured Litoreibacter sp.]